ncbi:hypothetical protein Pcinc_042321 [Petrolisthes cinctipes]|uniref:Uncharacterized protein n=1 Tax=Petrolisthes cinctipes TaxID=88211 RepID=A0AAE1BI34_PETCI|nr:hypothetical protein Pcinc_042321 [Petrolisthes cinctipes]
MLVLCTGSPVTLPPIPRTLLPHQNTHLTVTLTLPTTLLQALYLRPLSLHSSFFASHRLSHSYYKHASLTQTLHPVSQSVCCNKTFTTPAISPQKNQPSPFLLQHPSLYLSFRLLPTPLTLPLTPSTATTPHSTSHSVYYNTPHSTSHPVYCPHHSHSTSHPVYYYQHPSLYLSPRLLPPSLSLYLSPRLLPSLTLPLTPSTTTITLTLTPSTTTPLTPPLTPSTTTITLTLPLTPSVTTPHRTLP